jgi:hypothetical protein
VCIRHPYNVEVRVTCPPPAIPETLPVVVRLDNANSRLVSEQSDSVAPFLLWAIPVWQREIFASARVSSRTAFTT